MFEAVQPLCQPLSGRSCGAAQAPRLGFGPLAGREAAGWAPDPCRPSPSLICCGSCMLQDEGVGPAAKCCPHAVLRAHASPAVAQRQPSRTALGAAARWWCSR